MSFELRELWKSAGGRIPDEWNIVSLESLLQDSKSIAVGVMYPGPETLNGVPLIKVGDIKGGCIPVKPAFCISAETNHEYRRSQLIGDELLITLVGNPGECVIVTPQMAGWNAARAIAVVKLKDVGLRTYIKTVLESSAGKHLIDSVLNTTVQKTLNLKDIRRLPIPIPANSTIKNISKFSEALSDRITLLRETNATLEAIAQALFKSWFVDFDPVRAKSEGKLPEGMDEATAALFPNSFEQTEIGIVPKGWKPATLSALAAFQNGYAFKGSDWVEQGHPVIKIGNVKPLLIDFDGCSYVSPETVLALDHFKLNRGDLLVGMTGYVGETGLVTQTEVDSYLNQRVGRIITSKGLDDLGFLFAAVRQAEFKAYAENQSHGSAQANVSGADLMKFSVVIPSVQVLDTFNQVASKLIEKIIDNYEEAKTLANLRDALLPRLISGQLRVADDKEEIEKVSA
jgi:type I restriction enzyme S subunit